MIIQLSPALRTYSFNFNYGDEINKVFIIPLDLKIQSISIVDVLPDYSGNIKVFIKNEDSFKVYNLYDDYTYAIAHNLGQVGLPDNFSYISDLEDIEKIEIFMKYFKSDPHSPLPDTYPTNITFIFDYK